MKKVLPSRIMDFNELKQNNYYFVDKTLIIKEFLERKIQATLIMRPRRFGKTLNMSMMAEFFDITKASKEIFKDTKIMETEYAKELNQWPTIFISFANAKGQFSDVVEMIKMALRNEFERYSYLFVNMNQFETFDYNNILSCLMGKETDLNYIGNSLAFLMKMLEKYYGKKVMVFIDEYDTPFIEAYVNGYYNEIKNALSSLLHNSLKTSLSLECAMLTGIQRVAKGNIFSGLNNLVVHTVNDERYSQYFGFTKEETKELLNYYELELNDDVKNMYDGYHFGSHDIYNPWSIINYADNKELISYWVNTSSNSMIKQTLKNTDISFKQGYEELITKGSLDTSVLMETSFYEQSDTGSLWGLFVNAGYLTVEKVIRNRYFKLRIPNEEVKEEFKSLTSYYLNTRDVDFENLYTALELGKKDIFVNAYTNILETLPSSHDLKSENSYHMMVLGICAWMSSIYKIESNKEEGLGRGDIVLTAKQDDLPSYVLEFKYTKEENSDLNKLADEGIQQIINKKYDIYLKGKIIYIGLAHYKKNVAIKWQEK